jgi:hypothetical protein
MLDSGRGVPYHLHSVGAEHMVRDGPRQSLLE